MKRATNSANFVKVEVPVPAANVVPKLVAMATSLTPSISAMSSLDSLSLKTHP